jgi:hypothetical protein
MRLRSQAGFISLVFLTAEVALGQIKTEDQVNVVTVCDILLSQTEFNGKTVAVLGRFDATDEGAWLTEDDCGHNIEASGTALHISVWLEWRGGPSAATSKTPALDKVLLKVKLAQAAKTTKLGKHVRFQCTISAKDQKPECGWPEVQDQWAVAYGRVETQGHQGYGFGHLAGAAAQVLEQAPLVFIDEKPQDAEGVQGK